MPMWTKSDAKINHDVVFRQSLFWIKIPNFAFELDEQKKSGWKLLLINHEKCVLLKSTEHSETIDLETPDNENVSFFKARTLALNVEMEHESHVSIRRCIDPLSTSDIMRSLTNTSLRFQENLRSILSFVQPLQIAPELK